MFYFIFLNNNKTEKASGRKTIGIITKGMLIDEKKWGGGGFVTLENRPGMKCAYICRLLFHCRFNKLTVELFLLDRLSFSAAERHTNTKLLVVFLMTV